MGHVAYEPRVMSSPTEDGSWNGAFKEFAIYVTDDSSGNPANWGAPVATGEWFWPNLQARRDVVLHDEVRAVCLFPPHHRLGLVPNAGLSRLCQCQ